MSSVNGTVKHFDSARGYGFCSRSDGGEDVFVDISTVEAAGLSGLTKGDHVVLEVERGNRGPRATSISLADAND